MGAAGAGGRDGWHVGGGIWGDVAAVGWCDYPGLCPTCIPPQGPGVPPSRERAGPVARRRGRLHLWPRPRRRCWRPARRVCALLDAQWCAAARRLGRWASAEERRAFAATRSAVCSTGPRPTPLPPAACRTPDPTGFVNVDSEKMSKSLGNFFTIRWVGCGLGWDLRVLHARGWGVALALHTALVPCAWHAHLPPAPSARAGTWLRSTILARYAGSWSTLSTASPSTTRSARWRRCARVQCSAVRAGEVARVCLAPCVSTHGAHAAPLLRPDPDPHPLLPCTTT